jgi:hypothetical protein
MRLSENLPPLPGTEEPEAPRPSLKAYILRGDSWVEIGTAVPHPDGKGHQLRLDIAPADGDVIELRATDPEHYPGAEQRRTLAAKKRPYAKPRIGAFRG